MNRILKLLLCAALLTSALAFAAMGEGTAQEGIELNLDGRSIRLGFDSSREYSAIDNGKVQASFYAYADNGDNLYELFMIFPEDVKAGDVVTPESAAKSEPDCSVVMIITSSQDEYYYFAGQLDGVAYPDASSYAMTFDAVSDASDARSYSGRLTANLSGMEVSSGNSRPSIRIEDAPFSFTMPLGNRVSDPVDTLPPQYDNPFEDLPQSTPAPQESYRI